MEHVDYYFQDPIIQLVLFATLAVCVYDFFKFVLNKFARILGFKDDEE
jgi:hypothetical protein